MTGSKGFLHEALARWLKVPPEPHPPAGSPGSVRIFRAAPSYFRLQQWVWGLKQAWLVVAALAFAVIFHQMVEEGKIRLPHVEGPGLGWINWLAGGFVLFHVLPLVLELLSLPFTYALIWLDYDQRWYIATDRSLRIREGVWRVREMTLTYANIQQITVRQGPLQRMLGISDLVVTTAGGGSGGAGAGKPGHATIEPIHTGVLRGVDNADSIRDLILARMRQLKDAGLGDPDDAASGGQSRDATGSPASTGQALVESAAALKAEVGALRAERIAAGWTASKSGA